jgi:DNA polymerase-1
MAVSADLKNKILILDGYNLLYRARYSARWQKDGPHTITYNFYRSLRKLVEDLKGEKVYFVLEGSPKDRLEAAPDYKGTREYEKDENYSNQKREIINILIEDMPVTVVKHPNYECDDIIAHIAYKEHPEDDVVIVSTDTDFHQVFAEHQSIQVYNPVKKKFVEPPEYDYVAWKALRGDSADNIKGFKGVGDKTAAKLVSDENLLKEFIDKVPGRSEKFAHNIFMIKFHSIAQLDLIQRSKSDFKVDSLYEQFTSFQFHSIIKEKPWKKFIGTFGVLA